MQKDLDLAQRFGTYLESKMPDATDVKVFGFSRIHGGASRETYRLTVTWTEDGKQVEKPMIVRREPTGSLVDYERDVEFNAYRAFYGTDIPVPQPLYYETDSKWLDRPFFVMEQIVGAEASSPIKPFGPLAEKVGQDFWTYLGQIAAIDPQAIGLADKMETVAVEQCWNRELTYWERVIDEKELNPQPIVRAAIRWLRKNPPPPPQKLSVVHGDYRVGNFLYNEDGKIQAILDWEGCHLGDPLEDIGWAIDPMWSFGSMERPGGMVERAEAFRIWEEASGLKLDPHALLWWETFNIVKGLAIWISSATEYEIGKNQDPVLFSAGFFPTLIHNEILVKRMSALVGGVVS